MREVEFEVCFLIRWLDSGYTSVEFIYPLEHREVFNTLEMRPWVECETEMADRIAHLCSVFSCIFGG